MGEWVTTTGKAAIICAILTVIVLTLAGMYGCTLRVSILSQLDTPPVAESGQRTTNTTTVETVTR